MNTTTNNINNNTNNKKKKREVKKTIDTVKTTKEAIITIKPNKTIQYLVKLDIDKDLDLLLITALLERRGIKSILNNGSYITCGLYSNKQNAINTISKIHSLGYKAIIVDQEV